jgi:hypothetical protein
LLLAPPLLPLSLLRPMLLLLLLLYLTCGLGIALPLS